MLRGSYAASIDEKGRMRIPAVFKRYFKENYAGCSDFYVTSVTGESALLYPMREWETIEAKLALLPSQEPAKKKFLDRTNYFGQAQAIDAQGRILIHPLLRGKAELLGEVTVFGYLTYLEVWSAERFRALRLDAQPWTDDDAEQLARLGI
jgi:MraZ protein